MKDHNLPKMHKIASSDDLREPLKYVLIDDEGIAVATNGHVLLMADITDHIVDWEHLKNKMIHRQSWKIMEKGEVITAEKDHISVSQGEITITVPCKERPENGIGDFPNYRSVLPDRPDGDSLKEISSIGLNPAYLETLRIAMKLRHNRFEFYFYGRNKPIIIQVTEFDGLALLMPVMLQGTNPEQDLMEKYLEYDYEDSEEKQDN